MNNLRVIAMIAGLAHAPKLWVAALLTVVFAAFGRLVRGVTDSGAVAGAVTCFALLVGAGWAGFATLCGVFVLTWAATRFGYARKQSLGTAEGRAGRTAAQVLANLGVAAACAVVAVFWRDIRIAVAIGAALAEAASDTVSSEIGQAVGGIPRLVTTWQEVSAGSDGAVTFTGTVAGLAASLAVSAVYAALAGLGWRGAAVCAGAGFAGTIADSLMGATIEPRGLVGNNTVNFLSTLVAAAVGFLIA
jgi:uncharacterized protein (TIGR00297 family)